ncbi:pyrroline-5-carboxylate reductase [Lactobacillus sp. LL6]|uniref:pyrroline-5-carboxylate reductase n=1 Tax=Lactobacillus sp. LL6 TaxID=2596827 RepID=UPI001185D936|nr:pyrroline-5-carboxylate reductase [Lactobacillus sp. LL6]TSO25484.1 pyrroline-5-carboxylate reductase [Lactobacillus sp. LL6]
MKIAIIGVGHMGSAMIEGLSKNPNNQLIAENHKNPRVEKLSKKYNFKLVNTIPELVKTEPEIVILTLPANVTLEVAHQLQDLNSLFISAAAGISYYDLSQALPNKAIARIIPNTPVSIQAGTIGLFTPQNMSVSYKNKAVHLLSQLGEIVEVEEDKLSIVGTIGGCGPAFVDVFIEALNEAGVLNGLDSKTATKLAASMVKGSADLALKSSKNPTELLNEVCSPGGTTIKGVVALEKSGFRYSVINAVNKANQN